MTHEETERMNELCRKIQAEKDHTKFSLLIEELNQLLEKKDHRLELAAKMRLSEAPSRPLGSA